MKIIDAGYEIIDIPSPIAAMKKLERIGRICYQSEEKSNGTFEGACKFVGGLIKRGHEAMLEHCSMTVIFTVDRGITHELVRHRLASFAQESTRYCNYGGDRKDVTFIRPFFITIESILADSTSWEASCHASERLYLKMLKDGASPQEARSVLTNSAKSQIAMTANIS